MSAISAFVVKPDTSFYITMSQITEEHHGKNDSLELGKVI